MQINHKPGSNIDAWCGKCKMLLAHTIEAMVGEKPARVHCNTCKSQHGYKPHAPNDKAQPGTKAGSPKRAASTSRRSSANRYQSLVMGSETKVVETYSPRNKYESGDLLEHPQFGRGAVTAVKDGTKIEVLFQAGPKTLVHSG
jgi:hypothetical protein